MSNQFDVERHDMDSLNEQMLGSKDSEIIDVTATSTTEDSASRKFRFRKLTRRQMGYLAGVLAVIAVVAVAVKKQNETHLDVVLPANISAILEKSVTKPPMPVDQPLPSSVDVAITAPAADIASTPAASTPQPASGVAVDTVSPSLAPSDRHSKAQPSPVDIEIDPLKKELAAVKNELASKTAEIAALKSAAAKPKSVKLATAVVTAAEKSAAKPMVVAKPKLKETHDLSMKESGIAVLMDGGLIYSSESGDFVEVSINQDFPGYGKLVRVDKDAKTFETPNHIYFLKD